MHKPYFAMRAFGTFILMVCLLAAPALRADVTIRYKTDFKVGAMVPPAMSQQGSNSPKLPFPPIVLVQVKGDKGASNAGLSASLIDFTKQEITILDATNKLFATVAIKDYWGELTASMPTMPAVPPAAQAILASIKSDFSCSKTGRTDSVVSVMVEENECTFSMSLPIPAGLPMPPGMFQPGQPVTVIKLVMQRWSATPAEVQRVPALSEFMTYSSSSAQLLNPAASMQQILGKLPFIGQNFEPMIEEFSKNPSATLKMHAEIFIPVLAQIAPILQAQGHPLPAGFDPNAALAVVDMVATELSSAPIDASVFQVPADYHATPLADLLKSLMPAPKASTPAAGSFSGRP